jgi:hypothetical protein
MSLSFLVAIIFADSPQFRVTIDMGSSLLVANTKTVAMDNTSVDRKKYFKTPHCSTNLPKVSVNNAVTFLNAALPQVTTVQA